MYEFIKRKKKLVREFVHVVDGENSILDAISNLSKLNIILALKRIPSLCVDHVQPFPAGLIKM